MTELKVSIVSAVPFVLLPCTGPFGFFGQVYRAKEEALRRHGGPAERHWEALDRKRGAPMPRAAGRVRNGVRAPTPAVVTLL